MSFLDQCISQTLDESFMKHLLWPLLIAALLLSACGGDDATPSEETGNNSSENNAANNNNSTEQALTFHKDIKPILEDHCWRCHYDGGQGPGDFTKPENVEVLAPSMLAAIDDKRMPPPVSDPACRDYLGADKMSMPPQSREIFAKWLDEGMNMGEDDGQAAAPSPEPVLENPDIELALSQGYAPTYDDPDNPGNEYRCFALEHGKDEPFYITGMHPIIDQAAIVHHVVLAKIKRSALPAETLEAGGQNCINDMGALGSGADGDGIIGAWAPGMEPVLFEDAGLQVTPDDVLVLQMHYYFSGPEVEGVVDHSGYALKTAPSVKTPIRMAPLGTDNFMIPAGDDAYSIEEDLEIPVKVTVWGVFPHMHVLGRQYSMSFGEEGEETCLLQGERYDFNNQLTYMFKEPVEVPANTPIRFSCTWDNSTNNPALIHNPPVDVGYGERTDEEMCFAFTYFSIGGL